MVALVGLVRQHRLANWYCFSETFLQEEKCARLPRSRCNLQWLSEYLGAEEPISHRTIYNWRLRGEGPPAYRIGKYLRYRRSDVDAWLEGKRDKAEKLAG